MIFRYENLRTILVMNICLVGLIIKCYDCLCCFRLSFFLAMMSGEGSCSFASLALRPSCLLVEKG